jgi:hypothetical protein
MESKAIATLESQSEGAKILLDTAEMYLEFPLAWSLIRII